MTDARRRIQLNKDTIFMPHSRLKDSFESCTKWKSSKEPKLWWM